MWAVAQGAKPIREEFGADCLVAINVFYPTEVTVHLLVLRNVMEVEMDGFSKKRVAMFDRVIHSPGRGEGGFAAADTVGN